MIIGFLKQLEANFERMCMWEKMICGPRDEVENVKEIILLI
jgi:hypothetical protein